MVNEEGEKLWRTASGDDIPYSEVTQQHWSNIYWYHLYVIEYYDKREYHNNSIWLYTTQSSYEDRRQKFVSTANLAKTQIDLRFDGEILEWTPKYEDERAWYKQWITRKVLLEKYKFNAI